MKKNWDIEELMKLGWQFCDSCIFFTALELGVFDSILKEAKDAEQIANELGTDTRGTTILLNVLAALGFLIKDGNLYRLDDQFSKYMDPENPENARGILEHLVHLWDQWHDLTRIVKGEIKIEKVSVLSKGKERLKSFIQAMDVVSRAKADDVVRATAPGNTKSLLDVGGASGTYTLAFLRSSSTLQATIFDLPEVIEIAKERLKDSEYLDRISFVAGDFYKDPLPDGHDLAFVSAIIHQNSPEQNEELFRKVFEALVPGGRVVIRDYVMDESKASPPSGAIFAVNMLVNTPGGNTYTFMEIKDMLENAGFINVRLLQKKDDMNSLVEAFKN